MFVVWILAVVAACFVLAVSITMAMYWLMRTRRPRGRVVIQAQSVRAVPGAPPAASYVLRPEIEGSEPWASQ